MDIGTYIEDKKSSTFEDVKQGSEGTLEFEVDEWSENKYMMDSFLEDIKLHNKCHLQSEKEDFGQILEEFFQKHDLEENTRKEMRQYVHMNSYLHFSMKYFHEEFLRHLLKRNADLNQTNFNKEFPFETNTDTEQRKKIYAILCDHFKSKVFDIYDEMAKFVWKVEICFTKFRGRRRGISVVVHISRNTSVARYSNVHKVNNVNVDFVFNNDVSLEAKTVQMHERLENLHCTDFVDREIGKELFEKHSNLNAIRPSPLRSRGYGTPNHSILHESCIILYCTKKGYIPINERMFPTQINGIRTDVREGFFLFGTDKIKHGDEIYRSSKSGTLGGFVKICDNSLGFMTCAHVLYDTNELIKLQSNGFSGDLPSTVYKPDDNFRKNIGNIVDAKFITDIQNTCSIDAAVVGISDTFKRFVDFSYPEIIDLKGLPKKPSFSKTGSLSDTLYKGTNRVIKYGSTTQFTVGTLQFDAKSHVRYVNKDLHLAETLPTDSMDVDGGNSFHMYNQLCVNPAMDHKFFSAGDSGALVYLLQDPTKHIYRCIGMAVGELSDGVCIVTDIQNIISSFQGKVKLIEPQTVIDDAYVTNSSFQKSIDDLHAKLKGYFDNVDAKLDKTLDHISKLDERVSKLEEN